MTEGRIFFLKFDRVSPNIEHWTPMAALKRRSPNLSYRRKYIGVSEVSSAPSPPCIPFSLLLPAYVHIRRLVALEKYIVLACKCATLARGHGSVCYIVCRLADQVLAICVAHSAPALVKGRNMRERYSFVCQVIIAAAVMNPNLCTRLPRVRSTR